MATGMKELGKKEKISSQPVPETKEEKVVVTFPDVRLDSGMLKAVKECEIDEKYILTFVASVSGIRKPSEWDIKENRYTAGDVIADFKLSDGSIRPYRKDKLGKEV